MRRFLLLIVTVFLLLSAGCNYNPGGFAPRIPYTPAPAIASEVQKLMLFGGMGHRTYLGCLNCPKYADDSVFNPYGEHGSPYGSESIGNHYGDFGSAYSEYSACSPYASDPPVVVDGRGSFYGGRLSYAPKSLCRIPNVLAAVSCRRLPESACSILCGYPLSRRNPHESRAGRCGGAI